MRELDPEVAQPTRLRILAVLSGVGRADFGFLRTTLGLTQGNLSSHMLRLEEVGYVETTKGYAGRVPKTSYRLTGRGRAALEGYWQAVDELRQRAAPRPARARRRMKPALEGGGS
jgi:DNA-binding MarR family transcriptional regulator